MRQSESTEQIIEGGLEDLLQWKVAGVSQDS